MSDHDADDGATGWYAVRTVVRFPTESAEAWDYEERITLWWARSFDEAIAQAEDEVDEYVDLLGHGESAGLAQAYHLVEPELTSGAEVFSLIRRSSLDADDYVDRFFDAGGEHQGHTPG